MRSRSRISSARPACTGAPPLDARRTATTSVRRLRSDSITAWRARDVPPLGRPRRLFGVTSPTCPPGCAAAWSPGCRPGASSAGAAWSGARPHARRPAGESVSRACHMQRLCGGRGRPTAPAPRRDSSAPFDQRFAARARVGRSSIRCGVASRPPGGRAAPSPSPPRHGARAAGQGQVDAGGDALRHQLGEIAHEAEWWPNQASRSGADPVDGVGLEPARAGIRRIPGLTGSKPRAIAEKLQLSEERKLSRRVAAVLTYLRDALSRA